MIEPNCRKIIRFEKSDYFLFGLDQIVGKIKICLCGFDQIVGKFLQSEQFGFK